MLEEEVNIYWDEAGEFAEEKLKNSTETPFLKKVRQKTTEIAYILDKFKNKTEEEKSAVFYKLMGMGSDWEFVENTKTIVVLEGSYKGLFIERLLFECIGEGNEIYIYDSPYEAFLDLISKFSIHSIQFEESSVFLGLCLKNSEFVVDVPSYYYATLYEYYNEPTKNWTLIEDILR